MEIRSVFSKTMGQRILSLMLVTIMVVGLFPPIPVHAEGTNVYGVLMSDGCVYATNEGNTGLPGDEIDRKEITHLYVDEGVTSIEQNAFQYCDKLTMVSMPSVKTIGDSAFSICSKLTSVFQPSVTSIGHNSFQGCGLLSSVDLPEVLSIGSNGFVGCEALASVNAPKLSTIDDYAFNACANLANLTLGATPPTVGANPFGGAPCTNLIIDASSVPAYELADSSGDQGYWYGWALSYPLTVRDGSGSGYYRTGSRVSVTANEPAPGKQFLEWFEEGKGPSIIFDPETAAETSFFMPCKKTTIIALYEDIPVATFTVTFNENNGVGATTSQSISAGAPQNLTPNAFTRADYSFAGWNTAADGKGTSYADGVSFTATGDITLYAQWTENTPSPAAEPGYGVLRVDNKIYTTNIGNTKTDGVEMTVADVTHLYVANDVTEIALTLFANRRNLIEVNAPRVTTIGASAFSGCTNLTTINFPEAILLGGSAFRLCESLTTVSLPKVTAVNSYEFMDCINLTNAYLPEALTFGEMTFSGCKKLTTLTSPKVTTIGKYVFTGCVGLMSLDLPSATEIGDYAFCDCSGLTSINLPVATTIGYCAFSDCNALITVDLPLVTILSDYAFGFMGGLSSVRLPAIISIGAGAFYDCPKLADLAIGVSPPTVGEDAFQFCLKTNISFVGATTTTDIKASVSAYEDAYATANPADERVGYWYGWALPHTLKVTDGVVNNPSDTGLYPTGATISVTANTPPEGQRFVNWGTMQDRGIVDDDVVFANAKAPTTTFVMPGRYTSILAGFETIPQYTVTFNANGGSGRMFAQLFNDGETKNLTHNTFTGVDCLFAGWNTSADGSGTAFADETSFTASANTTLYAQWVYEYGVLRDDGKVYMTNQDNTKTDGQLINRTSVKYLFVDADVTIIDEIAFLNCANLVTVDLSKVASLIIKKDAFHGCTGLTTIDLKNVTTVGDSSFEGCELLTTVDLQKATEIGTGSFGDCSGLTTVNIPKLTSIPKEAFYECANLTTIDLAKVTTINEFAFALCTKLKTIDLSAVTTVGRVSFGRCTSLEEVDMPILTTLPEYLFAECTSLKTVSIPKATELKEGAFIGCTALTDLTVSATPPTVGDEVFKDGPKTNLRIDGGNTTKAIGDYNAVDDGDVRENCWYGWQLKVDVYDLVVNGGTGGGNFAQGTDVTITAGTPIEGQRFKSWSQAGVTLAKATDATTTFVMPGNAVTVTAEYEAMPYALTVNGGTGGGNFAQGTEVTITAGTAPTGQRFKSWSQNGVTLAKATDATTTFIMPGNAVTVTAEYEAIPYALTVNGGTGSGNFAQGTDVTITAGTAPTGQRFKSWSQDGVTLAKATDATTTFVMPGNAVTVTAEYEAIPYSLTVNGGTGSGNFAQGTDVTITAGTAPTGQRFKSWSQDGVTLAKATDATTTFVMPGNAVTVTAEYEAIPYALTVNGGTGGGNFTQGTEVTITAGTAPTGQRFKAWIQNGVTLAKATDESTSFVMPGNAVTVTAEYEAIPYALIVSGGTGSGNFIQGTEVTITAGTPTAGQRFKSWSQDGITLAKATDATTSFVMPGNAVTVTAEYEVISYSLTVNGGTGGGNFAQGTEVTITSGTAPTGQRFKSWSQNGITLAKATDATTSFVMPGNAVTVTAEYEAIPYALTVNGGTGSGNFAQGTEVTITAGTAPTGQRFKSWTQNGVTLAKATDATTSFIMPGNAVTVTAEYEAIPYALTVNGGTGSGNFTQGTEVTITAGTAPTGQRFKSWTQNGVTLAKATDATTTFVMPGNAVTVTAEYEAIPYALTVNGGTGGGNFAQGTEVTITAGTPTAGQRFKSWSQNGVTLAKATDATTTFVMPGNAVTVTAEYEAIPIVTYALTVTGGTGGGNFAQGTEVTITAGTPTAGQRFKSWSQDGVTLAKATDSTTTFVMPGNAVMVTAEYEAIPYALIVNGGTGSGNFTQGTEVTITAGIPTAGQRFKSWTQNGVTLAKATDATTTFVMPGNAVTITAEYEAIPIVTYALTVNNGTGGGNFAQGTEVTITAGTAPSGQRFKSWTQNGVTLAKATDATTTFVMPGNAVTVTAEYEAIVTHTVTYNANGGTGSMSPQVFTGTTAQNLSINTLTRTGCGFSGWSTNPLAVNATYADGATYTATADTTLYALWTDGKYDVAGTVGSDASHLLPNVRVTLVQGNVQIGETFTDADGFFTIKDVGNGNYNLVVTTAATDDVASTMVTTLVNVTDASPAFSNIIVPTSQKTNSVVVVEDKAPAIVVGNLDQQFTQAERDSSMPTEMKFVADVTDKASHPAVAISERATKEKQTVGIFIDFSMFKTSETINSGKPVRITQLDTGCVEIFIPLDESQQQKDHYVVYRYHGSEINVITETENDDHEIIDLIDNNTTIKLTAKKFSTYAVAYDAPVPTPPTPGPGPTPVPIKTYALTYNANGGSGTMVDQVFTESTKQALVKNTFARTGYTFTGWNTKQDGTGTAYADKADFTAVSTSTLYAQWTKNEITVPDGVTYRTHIQNIGWEKTWAVDGTRAGSEGQSLRLEGIEIKLTGDDLPVGAHIEYRTHVQNTGWEKDWTADGDIAGTVGKSLRLEAIQIRLVNMPGYSVEYRTHVQNDGWETDWSADGESAGTEGRSLRLEAIEIRLVKVDPGR